MSVKSEEVAALLLNDQTLLLELELFYSFTKPQQDQWQKFIQALGKHPDSFSLLISIMSQFALERRNKGKIKDIGNILDGMGRVVTKEILLTKFRGNARIISETDSSNKDKALLKKYEDNELKMQTKPTAISILQLMPEQSSDKGRLAIVVTHLLKILTEIGEKPVAIVSINGKQRSGKSFLATQFIKYLKYYQEPDWLDKEMNENFIWRDDFERVTSGIQVWHEPFYLKHDGREIAVIVMDTQGLHDSKTGPEENSLIFGLSVLLSSVFIYNEKHAGDDSLQFMQSFLEFAKFACEDEQGSNPSQNITFQKLIVLLRDWQSFRQFKFGYYDDKACPRGQVENLKKKFFNVSPEMHPKAQATRKGITSCFEQIGVYAMATPVPCFPDDPRYKLASKWEPDFRDCVEDFVEQVLSPENISKSVKTLFGADVTAAGLRSYVEGWAEQIKKAEGAVPTQTIFESTVSLYFNQKLEAAIKEYENEMKDYLKSNEKGVEEDVFQLKHTQLVEKVLRNFLLGKALGGNDAKEQYANLLGVELDEKREDFSLMNQTNIENESNRMRAEQERIELDKQNEKNQEEMDKRMAEVKLEMQKRQFEHEQKITEMERKREVELAKAKIAEAEQKHKIEMERREFEAKLKMQEERNKQASNEANSSKIFEYTKLFASTAVDLIGQAMAASSSDSQAEKQTVSQNDLAHLSRPKSGSDGMASRKQERRKDVGSDFYPTPKLDDRNRPYPSAFKENRGGESGFSVAMPSVVEAATAAFGLGMGSLGRGGVWTTGSNSARGRGSSRGSKS